MSPAEPVAAQPGSGAKGTGANARSRHRSVIAAVLLLAVLAGIVVAVVARRDPGVIPAPVPPPPPSPTAGQAPRSLLLQIRDDQLVASQAAIVGVRWLAASPGATASPGASGSPASPDASGSAGAAPGAQVASSTLTLPAVTTIDLSGAGPVTVGTSGMLSQGDAVRLTSAQTGVRIDGALTLDRLAFAGLVDNAGQLTVVVPRNTTIPNTDPGTPTAPTRILLAGTQRMDGQTAAAYALAEVPGEPVADRGARFLAVWNATLRALPAEPERIRQVLTSLGALARSNVSSEDVATILAAERQSLIDGTAQTASLPVNRYGLRAVEQAKANPTPGVRPVTLRGWRIEQPTADPVLTELFADLLLPSETVLPKAPTASPSASASASGLAPEPAPSPTASPGLGGPRVAVMGGGANLAEVNDASAALRDAGAVPVWRGWESAPRAANRRQPVRTLIYVRPDSRALGLQLAAALSLPSTAIKVGLGPANESSAAAAPQAWVLLGPTPVDVESSNP